MLVLLEVIHVDIKHPERVRFPFKIMSSSQLVGAEPNKTFQGFIIELRVHPCDALGQDQHIPFDFKAHLYSSHEVVFECPPMDYTAMGLDNDHVREYLQEDDGSYSEKIDEVLMEAMDNYRNNLNDRIDNQEFPIKKQYRLIFDSSVQLNASVLESNEKFKDSNRLNLYPLPISYEIAALGDVTDFDEDTTWDDLDKQTVSLKNQSGVEVEQDVYIVKQPIVMISQFAVELADLNKDARKKGKIVKAADIGGATAMMSALGKKKKKKGTS